MGVDPVAAQDVRGGFKVEQIRVEGAQRIEAETVKALDVYHPWVLDDYHVVYPKRLPWPTRSRLMRLVVVFIGILMRTLC